MGQVQICSTGSHHSATRRTLATLPNGVTIDYAYESGDSRFGAGSCAAGA